MANVTISMDEETLRWARVQAAHAGVSLSRWLGAKLTEERMNTDEAAARREQEREALETLLAMPLFDLGPEPLPTREEVYEDALRRHSVVRGYERDGLLTQHERAAETGTRLRVAEDGAGEWKADRQPADRE